MHIFIAYHELKKSRDDIKLSTDSQVYVLMTLPKQLMASNVTHALLS